MSKGDPHNLIPFNNLDLKKARRGDFSPYAQLTEALKGWLVFDRETRLLVDRHELWGLYHNKSKDRKKLMSKSHTKYIFISKELWATIQVVERSMLKNT